MSGDDPNYMTCERWRDAISAIIDDEDPGLDRELVDAHLRRCPSCRQFDEVSRRANRIVRVRVADPVPDLSQRVSKLVAVADRASKWSIVRALLAVVAVEIIALSIVSMLAVDSSGGPAHDSRHLGAFSIAYAVGLLVVVARPARARTMLPVAGVLAGALVITATIDLVNGNVPFRGETSHFPEVASVVLVWLLAVPSKRRSPAVRLDPSRLGALRSVPDGDADTAAGRHAG